MQYVELSQRLVRGASNQIAALKHYVDLRGRIRLGTGSKLVQVSKKIAQLWLSAGVEAGVKPYLLLWMLPVVLAFESSKKTPFLPFCRGTTYSWLFQQAMGRAYCYGCLPGAFDRLRRSKAKSIVVVISPLVALMKDQVNNFASQGLSAGRYVGEDSSHEMKLGVLSGAYQLD